MSAMITIGELTACIAGDYRYSTSLKVKADPSTKLVTVTVAENGAAGGMDGPGGATPFHQTFITEMTDPTPRELVEAVRRAIDFEDMSGAGVLRKYGKPSKSFLWGAHYNARLAGLSQAKAKHGLDSVFP